MEDLGEGAAAVAELRVFVRDSHAAGILSTVDRLLDVAGWSRRDLDAFAVVRGPGSFTGIRVGLGLLRGLAVASGKPCVGVDALEAHAESFGPSAFERTPLLDASRGEVYGARYDPSSSPPISRVAPWLGPPERAAADGMEGGIVFGPGVERFRSRLLDAGVRLADGTPPVRIAAAAGRIASLRYRAGLALDAGLVPLYIRPSDAELGRR